MSTAKRTVTGSIVKLLTHTQRDRAMTLMLHTSRCLCRDEIHELVTTDQRDVRGGARIDRVGFLGFAEIAAGGVVERGDSVHVGERRIGRVLGFDDCHAPNHLNVLIATDELLTGPTAALEIADLVRFEAGEDGTASDAQPASSRTCVTAPGHAS